MMKVLDRETSKEEASQMSVVCDITDNEINSTNSYE